jgi:hypothetical protein
LRADRSVEAFDDPPEDGRAARLLRAAIGRSGPIAAAAASHPDAADPDAAGAGPWIALAEEHRIVPLLYVAARADGAGAWADTAISERIRRLQLDVASAAVRIEHGALVALGLLDAAGIRWALLKGVATAHLDHADPSWRQFGDVDLLVQPSDMDTARRVLGAAGWRQSYALPDRHERFTHAFTFACDGVLELDVHQRIGHRALGRLVPTEALLRERVSFELAGRTVWALSDLDRTIHACIHSVSSRGEYRRLSSVADVLVLSYLHEDRAAEVIERADGWRVRSVVEAGVRDAWKAAQLPLPDGWADAFRAPAVRRSWLVDRAYLGERRRPLSEELAHLRHLPDNRDRATYLWGLVAPGAEYRAVKGRRSVRAQLRYLWQRLRSR